MKSIIILFLIFCCVMFLSTSCENLIIEKDISDSNISIIAPVNELKLNATSVSFSWEALEGATKYQIQIAKPNFTSPTQIIFDSVLTETFVTFQIPIGNYEWRVRAINGSYKSQYTSRFFEILSNANFQDNIVVLTSPNNNLVTKTASQTLTWQSVIGAINYQIQVYNSANIVVLDQIITNNSFIYLFPEGNYQWRVRASDGNVNTLFSNRSILIDTTSPNIPTITTPINNSVVTNNNITFSWNRAPIAGSVEKDSIYIYSDNTLMNLLKKEQATSPYSTVLSNTGTIFWKVKSFDEAGNLSPQSTVFSFTKN